MEFNDNGNYQIEIILSRSHDKFKLIQGESLYGKIESYNLNVEIIVDNLHIGKKPSLRFRDSTLSLIISQPYNLENLNGLERKIPILSKKGYPDNYFRIKLI